MSKDMLEAFLWVELAAHGRRLNDAIHEGKDNRRWRHANDTELVNRFLTAAVDFAATDYIPSVRRAALEAEISEHYVAAIRHGREQAKAAS